MAAVRLPGGRGVDQPGGGACLVLALAFLSLRAQDATAAGALSAMAQSIGYLLAAAGPVIFGHPDHCRQSSRRLRARKAEVNLKALRHRTKSGGHPRHCLRPG
jgi:hypothetical protein